MAQTSKAHLMYLRDYASSLDIPIVSVDYSLSPDYPYPRALHESFYVYCWALTHPHLLGFFHLLFLFGFGGRTFASGPAFLTLSLL